MTNKDDKEFQLLEYTVASTAYHNGVTIGYTVIRNYIALNAVFFAGISIGYNPSTTSVAEVSNYVKIIPVVGVICAFIFLCIFPYYKEHLDNCQNRCADIEKNYGGKLFTRMAAIETRGENILDARRGFNTILIVVLSVWLLTAMQLKVWTVITDLF